MDIPNRKEIDKINKKLKDLLFHFLHEQKVYSVCNKFEVDSLVYDFLCMEKVKSLINVRNKVSIHIGNFKEKNNISVFDKVREKKIIDEFCKGADNNVKSVYEAVIMYVINLSKFIQYIFIRKVHSFTGTIHVNSDKSLVHRLLILSSLAKGETILTGRFEGLDIYSTIKCLRQIGVIIDITDKEIKIKNPNAPGFTKPDTALDAGNSGSTMRMLAGLLCAQGFRSEITGDESLLKRPMDRICIPLRSMGANIKCEKEKYPPIIINDGEKGNQLHSIDYEMPVPSAQVETAILMADLFSDGQSKVHTNYEIRDHTRRILNVMGYSLPLKSLNLYDVPADISSAAYYIIGTLLIPGSEININNILLNSSRTKYLDILKRMGADIIIKKNNDSIEEVGEIKVKTSPLSGTRIKNDEVSGIIDEIPLLTVAAVFADGETVIENPEELKNKESDRLNGLVENLSKIGVNIYIEDSNLIIAGNSHSLFNSYSTGSNHSNGHKPASCILDSRNDHRMAMAYCLFARVSGVPFVIEGLESVFISHPSFFENQL